MFVGEALEFGAGKGAAVAGTGASDVEGGEALMSRGESEPTQSQASATECHSDVGMSERKKCLQEQSAKMVVGSPHIFHSQASRTQFSRRKYQHGRPKQSLCSKPRCEAAC